MLLSCFLLIVFLLIGIVWAKGCISINRYILNSVWDIFYIFTFFVILFLLIYLNFFYDSLFWINSVLSFLLTLLFFTDLKVDSYFDQLLEKEK